jgi:beta-lactamase regulating signal transducer with metallopeptidase domain/predicted  nucleic acid-binding Zn-ribbon protein
MAPLAALLLWAFKGLVLLVSAAAAATLLQRKPARLRVVVWATALAGTLVIPAAAVVLPPIELPMLPRLVAEWPATEQTHPAPSLDSADTAPAKAVAFSGVEPTHQPAFARSVDVQWSTVLLTAWAAGAFLALARVALGVWRTRRLVGDAAPVSSPEWLAGLDRVRSRVGLRRAVRIVVSREVEIPATVGVLRPTVIVPLSAENWPLDRREAVLSHELVHISRLDWPLRLIARLARGCYWFNPLAWWAVRRLDLEQELACDEEVVALGTRPSVYACHLLGIARAVARQPAPAISVLGMASASHLEERIMSILGTTAPRRLGRRVLAPAAILVAALVPALAAVSPTAGPVSPEAPTQPQSPAAAPAPPQAPDIAEILAEIERVEERMQPQLAEIEAIEVEMAPALERISSIEIDDETMAAIEAELQPYLERLESIEIDMTPIEAEMEAIEERLEELELHIDDGTLEEIERQIHEQLEPLQEELERLHESMAPQLEQMEAIHEKLEPLHGEMERLGQRLEAAITAHVAAVLRDHLGSVTDPRAPLQQVAGQLLDDASIIVDDSVVRVSMSEKEAVEILSSRLDPHRTGSQDAFDAAVAAAAAAVSDLEITAR